MNEKRENSLFWLGLVIVNLLCVLSLVCLRRLRAEETKYIELRTVEQGHTH